MDDQNVCLIIDYYNATNGQHGKHVGQSTFNNILHVCPKIKFECYLLKTFNFIDVAVQLLIADQ